MALNNETIAGNEVEYLFNRNFDNLDTKPNIPTIINYSKEITFKSSTIDFDVFSFDFIYLKTKIINNLNLTSSLDITKILINFVE